MNRCLRLGVVIAALIVGLMPVGVAQAAFVISNGGLTATGTLADWIGYGKAGFEQQDKIWTYVSSDKNFPNPADVDITIETDVIVPGVKDIHTLTVDFDPHVQGPVSTTLNYTIAIDPAISPQFVFTQARLDSNSLSDNTTVVKTFNGGLLVLTSKNGADTGDVGIPGGPTLLTVGENFSADATGVLEGAVNAYTEQAVPEPATAAIWTLLGACGVGIGWWRRRKHG